MSSEVCPFCGKPFKRLKSHLPHCKAADRSKTPSTQRDVAVSQRTSSLPPSSSQLTPVLPEKTSKSKKSTPTLSSTITPQIKKSKALSSGSRPSSESSPPPPPLKSASSSSQLPSMSLSTSSSPSSTSLSTSTRRKKQKLADQIKMAVMSSSSTISLSSPASTSLSPSPSLSKPKKKDLRALIEAARSSPVPKGSLEGTKSNKSVSTTVAVATNPLSSKVPALKGTQDTDQDPYNTLPAPLSTETKPKSASKMKASKRETAAQSLSATKAYDSQDSKGEGAGNSARVIFWEDSEGEKEDFSGKERAWGSGSGHKARITLQDVKAILGRSNTSRQCSEPSILNTTDNLPCKTKTRGPLNTSLSEISFPALTQNEHGVSLLTPVAQSDQSPSTSSQDMELSPFKTESPKGATKSQQACLISPQDDGSTQLKPTSLLSPVTPPLSGPPTSLASPAALPRSTISINEGLKLDYHKMGLLSASVTQFMEGRTPSCASPSSFVPQCLPLPPQTLPVRVETAKANEGLMMETPQLEIRKQNVAECGIGGALTQRSLGQVTLREFPEWLNLKTPSHPREVVEMLQRGWQWYYRRYIDVRKGGVGGVGMLLAGYCVLSYMWSYPHIKRDRWRKYH